jgi:hypothetical protein
VLTQDSPLLENYYRDGEDLLIYKNDKDLVSHINFVINNSKKALDIANAGHQKTLKYVNEQLNINKFNNLLQRSKLKKYNKSYDNTLYVDKYFIRSIAAYDGDSVLKNRKNFLKFIQSFKLLLLDMIIIKIFIRKFIKSLYFNE